MPTVTRPRWFWFSFCLSIAGCTYINQPLNAPSVPPEQRIRNHTRAETFASVVPESFAATNPTSAAQELRPTTSPSDIVHDNDGYFVGLAISGGGSRSANFAAACIFQLEKIGLMQKVDYISSASGGSLAAAYYCLNRDGWNEKNVQEKLTHPFASDIWLRGFLPWNTLALFFTGYSRTDLLASTLRDNLFSPNGKQQTFADLLPDRPRLLINATDLQTGQRFIFCNQRFDRLNSDLASYPIAYAVAASSSVPVALYQVTLRDFSTKAERYCHVLDAGVADNLGIETLVEIYRAHVEAAQQRGLPDPYPHGAVFIVLDARVQSDPNFSEQRNPGFLGGIRASAGLSTSSMVSRASEAELNDVILRNAPDQSTAKEIRGFIDTLTKDGFVDFPNIGGHRIRVADFTLTQIGQLADSPPGLADSINGIDTYFNITPEQTRDLYLAAEILMKDRFREKLTDIVQEMQMSGRTSAE